MSLPSAPRKPYLISSVKSGATTADVTLGWKPLLDTGGVPLTGYKLYQKRLSDSSTSLAYDGSNSPEILQAVISGLELDEDY